MSTSYYHVTFTENIESIMAQGIHPGFPASWEQQGNRERCGHSDEIHAFTHYVDAKRWAGRMELAFFLKIGRGSGAIRFKACFPRATFVFSRSNHVPRHASSALSPHASHASLPSMAYACAVSS